MKLSSKYYEVVDKKILEMFEQYNKDYNAMFRRAKKLARKVGANTNRMATTGSLNYYRVMGFMFKTGQVPADWTGNRDRGYRPYKKSAIYKEWAAIGTLDTALMVQALKFKPMFNDGYFYDFNFGFVKKNPKKPIRIVFRVPIFEKDDYKMNPELKYRPPRGACKVVSHETQKKILS